jgi:hypothetical protein
MKKYNALIIGCGAQGVGVGQENNPDKIINFAHALTEHDGFNLITCVDKDEDKAMDAAQIWNTCHETDLKRAFYAKRDVAIITTPDRNHYEILKQLAEYPLRLVICEKPLCKGLQHAREIVELYMAKGIGLMVNYTRRFLPYYDFLKKENPLTAICRFNRGWLHSASHATDFFNMIGCENYEIFESQSDERVWDIRVAYRNFIFTEIRYGNQPVWPYYDKSHMHIINNAYEFLEGREEIKCTGKMALAALEKCYELMEDKK